MPSGESCGVGVLPVGHRVAAGGERARGIALGEVEQPDVGGVAVLDEDGARVRSAADGERARPLGRGDRLEPPVRRRLDVLARPGPGCPRPRRCPTHSASSMPPFALPSKPGQRGAHERADRLQGRSRPPARSRSAARARRAPGRPRGSRPRVTSSGLSGSPRRRVDAERDDQRAGAGRRPARELLHRRDPRPSPLPGASGRLRFAPPPPSPASPAKPRKCGNQPARRVDVDGARQHVGALGVEDRLGAVAVVRVDVDDRDRVRRAASRSRGGGDRGVVEVAGAAVRGARDVVAGRAACRRRRRARRRRRGRAAVSAASAPPRAASHVPGPISVIVSKASTCRSAPRSRPARRGERPEQRRGGGRSTARRGPGRGRPAARPPPIPRPRRRRNSSSAGSWTASSSALVGLRSRGDHRMAGGRRAPRGSRRRARATSTAGVRTPTQISARRRRAAPLRVAPDDRGSRPSSVGEPTAVSLPRRARSARPSAARGCASSGCGSARSRPGRRTRSPTSRACASATSPSGATRRRWRARG